MKRRAQKGIAVLVAILVVALAATTATLMLTQQALWVRQVENLGWRMQADAAARAGIEASRVALADAKRDADPELAREMARGVFDGLAPGPAAPDIGYADAQGVFNLNNLVRGESPSMADIEVFVRVLTGLGVAPELAAAVVDAIDGDSEVSVPGGAEDLDYLSMQPPQRAANRPMLDAGSLARVKGYTPDAVARVRRFVSALPEPTAINVNSAPAEILLAVFPGLSIEAAGRLIDARRDKPYPDLAAFRAALPEQATPVPGVALDVKSRYFTVTSRARSGRVEVAYQALIGRPGSAHAGIIWSRQGEQ